MRLENNSDSKGHAFESHRAYHVKPLVLLKRAVFLYFFVGFRFSEIQIGVCLVLTGQKRGRSRLMGAPFCCVYACRLTG